MSQRTSLHQVKAFAAKLPWLQFLRYAAAGVVSVAIEYGMLVLMVEYVGHDHLLFANAIAFTIASVCNYFISRYWVFERGKHRTHVEMMAYFVSAGIGLLINQLVLWSLVEGISLDYRIAKIGAIGAVVLWNYWIRRTWVFKS
uniref:GtrA family protein n=1 Tax=Roseihalotalea indica TaxID=2867963 RepID=A0AA49GSI5_9BACT|nr:GtrA family protein [Tunicatimonas sp. TK19036]